MEPSPAPSPSESGIITLRLSRRTLILAVALLALAVVPFTLGTVAVGGYFLWAHFDHQNRLAQAATTYTEAFSAETKSFESLLSAAELQKRELDAALTAANAASRPNTIPLERLTSEAETLRATVPRLERGTSNLIAIEARLRDQFRLKPGDRFTSAAHEAQLRDLRDRVNLLSSGVDRLPGQIASVAARRDELLAQAAAQQRAAAQRRAAQQKAAAARANPAPRATIVREVVVARPVPVFSVGFSSFGPAYYHRRPFYGPAWGHPGYRHGYCPRTGSRLGVGVAFSVR